MTMDSSTKWKFFATLLLLQRLAFGQSTSVDTNLPLKYMCNSSSKSVKDGVLERSLNLVLNSLVQNVPETGYNTSSSGGVYGVTECWGGLNASVCGSCVSSAKQAILQLCQYVSATVHLNGCFLRYETYDFYSKSPTNESGGFQCLCNVQSSGDLKSVDEVINPLLTTLVNKAISSNVGFSTLDTDNVYTLAQCWRYVNMKECRRCLDIQYQNLTSCENSSRGEIAVSQGCVLRYEMYKFYGDSNLVPTPSSPSKGKSQSRLPEILGLTLAVTFVVVLLFILGVVVWKTKVFKPWYRKPSFPQNPGMYKSSFSDYAAISKSKLNYQFQTLQIATKNFSQENKLGQGSFGSVYKGVLTEGREIAVKKLFASKEQGVKEFFNEVNLVSGVQHKNLVKMFGCSVDGPDRLLVYEYIPNKSLDQFLFGDENMRKKLDWARRFEIILGIAAGITYLHEQSEIRIIHRDIKASNILLDQHFKSKIADFGLARYFAQDRSHLSTGIAGTLGYVAPDYVVHGHLTEKVDVYSFGVLVLEIISGRKNHGQIDSNGVSQSLLTVVWNHYLSDTIPNIIDDSIEQNYHDEAMRVVYVALHCTQASATLRPPMSKVITLLTSNGPNLSPLTQPPFIDVSHSHSHSLSPSPSPSPSPSQSNIVDNSHNNSGYPLFNSAFSPALSPTVSLNTISTSQTQLNFEQL